MRLAGVPRQLTRCLLPPHRRAHLRPKEGLLCNVANVYTQDSQVASPRHLPPRPRGRQAGVLEVGRLIKLLSRNDASVEASRRVLKQAAAAAAR